LLQLLFEVLEVIYAAIRVVKRLNLFPFDCYLLLLMLMSYPYSIGKSVKNREIWVLQVGSPQNKKHRPGVPSVKLVAGVHGHEPVGREILLELGTYLCQKYAHDWAITEVSCASTVQYKLIQPQCLELWLCRLLNVNLTRYFGKMERNIVQMASMNNFSSTIFPCKPWFS
jgi:succinylglutamate desuccinylase